MGFFFAPVNSTGRGVYFLAYKDSQTVVGQRSAGNGPNRLFYCFFIATVVQVVMLWPVWIIYIDYID